MLPALTASRRRLPRRVALLAVALVLGVASIAVALAVPSDDVAPVPLADALAPATWGMSLPASWLAAPVALRPGDRVDVLAVRTGERAYALPIAFGLRVMAAGDPLVLEVDEQDAISIATARGGGLLLVTILRSTR